MDERERLHGLLCVLRGPVSRRSTGVRQVEQFFFRGRLYRMTCQYLRGHGSQMHDGCGLVLDTLKIDGLPSVN